MEEPDEDLVSEKSNKESMQEEPNEKYVPNLDLVPTKPKIDLVLEESNWDPI